MQPIVTVAEMQALDADAQESTPLGVLVERAGHAVACAAIEMLGGAYGRRVTVVAGKGNNGADGRVAADKLRQRGAKVEVIDSEPGIDSEPTPSGVFPADLVIDAAYGTGFRGEYRAPVFPSGVPVLAVDIPSGVSGDTGEGSGRPVRADRTVTFGAFKPGLLQSDGVTLAGRVTVADIGIPVRGALAHLMEDRDIADLVPPRRRDDNKWSSSVIVVAGSPGMTGAAALCARAAYRSGSGMICLGVPGADVADTPATEAVGVSLPHSGWADEVLALSERCSAMVVGPGLGRDPLTGAEVRRLACASPIPVLVDADGLYAFGRLDGAHPLRTEGTVVLTPHDGEYERLMGSTPGPDRIQAARRLARAAADAGIVNAVALVKGSTTTVADQSGRVLVSTAGSTRLATAGTGDVLSGVITALMARGVAPLEAAALGAHVHGRAASRGPSQGLVAGDLPELISTVLSSSCPDTPSSEWIRG
ncbi:MAG: NAD(P)H-hydrate dehydratase [Acidimicrobiales bacterium]